MEFFATSLSRERDLSKNYIVGFLLGEGSASPVRTQMNIHKFITRVGEVFAMRSSDVVLRRASDAETFAVAHKVVEIAELGLVAVCSQI